MSQFLQVSYNINMNLKTDNGSFCSENGVTLWAILCYEQVTFTTWEIFLLVRLCWSDYLYLLLLTYETNLVLNNHAFYIVCLCICCVMLYHDWTWTSADDQPHQAELERWEKCWHLETGTAIPLCEIFVCVLWLLLLSYIISASLFFHFYYQIRVSKINKKCKEWKDHLSSLVKLKTESMQLNLHLYLIKSWKSSRIFPMIYIDFLWPLS